ncbi:cation transporter, partial [Candidatus Calescamantes bacterium]|nr:cation transporter [Candidatus Calescamantes bacterium]
MAGFSFLSGMIMDRKGAAYKEGIVSIIINTILFGVKLSVGLLSGSLALISDAIHTMSDNVSSIFLMIAFKISGKEPDEDHPYGHERFEIMGTIVIGVLLLFTGIEIFRSGIISILSPKQISFTLLQIILIIISIVMKEGLAQYAMYLGKKFNAPAIKADGWHHRSDAISSAPVLLIIFFPGIDGWVSILISLVLIWESIDIIRKQLDDFLGKPPSRELINDIKNSVIKLEGVHNVHDIQLHRYGNTNVLSLHLEVEEKMNLFRAHTIAEQHEEMLSRKFHLSAVTIHIDPV